MKTGKRGKGRETKTEGGGTKIQRERAREEGGGVGLRKRGRKVEGRLKEKGNKIKKKK